MQSRVSRWLLGSLAACLLGSAPTLPTAFAQSADLNTETTLLPGGIADKAGKVGYVAGAKGGLEAVDLASGRMLWHAEGDLTPLLLSSQTIIATQTVAASASRPGQDNQIRIVRRETALGRQVFRSQPLVFPAWVSVAENGWGTTFRSQAMLEKNILLFAWEATKRPVYGNPPGGAGAPMTHAGGVMRVDLSTGEVAPQPEGMAARPFPQSALPTSVVLGQRTFTLVQGAAAGNDPYPRLLQCRDAATGALRWQHPLKPRPQDPSRLVM